MEQSRAPQSPAWRPRPCPVLTLQIETVNVAFDDNVGTVRGNPVLFEAGKPMLSDPNKIHPGQVLRIPLLS